MVLFAVVHGGFAMQTANKVCQTTPTADKNQDSYAADNRNGYCQASLHTEKKIENNYSKLLFLKRKWFFFSK
jgi:hypothetical protein